MAENDHYTAEQLARIRATLEHSLGEESGAAIDNLERRFNPAVEEPMVGEDGYKPSKKVEKKPVDVSTLVDEGKLKKMVDSLDDIQEDTNARKAVVAAVLRHKDVKAFHLVEALSKVSDDVELVDALVQGIISRKGVNPLIDSLRHATASPTAMKTLALALAEQGTVNHLIRAIATAPRNQPEAEIIWAMEIMRKAPMEQLLEAMNLMEDASPGSVILATGLVNRKEVAIEPLVRGLASCKNNAKASAILALELSRLADIPALIVLLEKYISDATEAGEILTAKLVQRSLAEKGRIKLMAKACRFMRGDSMSGKILAMGIVDQGDPVQLERAYERFVSHPLARNMVAIGIQKKVSGLKAFKLLGKLMFQISKIQPDVTKGTNEARQRYKWIIQEVFKESPDTDKPA